MLWDYLLEKVRGAGRNQPGSSVTRMFNILSGLCGPGADGVILLPAFLLFHPFTD